MSVARTFLRAFLISLSLIVLLPHRLPAQKAAAPIRGFRDSAAEESVEQKFLAVPDPKLAEEHLRTLTAAPHMAGTPEDKKTADYVAQKFREAGLETEIQEYKVWLNEPAEISVDVVAPANARHHGPTREHVNGDPYPDDPRVVMPFNGESPSGDAEAEAVYVNYGRPEDFKTLEDLKIDVRGKILVARYGENFRGVKAYLAQEHGAAGLLLYSDPMDDGYFKGDKYPEGPWRPDTGVQRGSVGYMFLYPGDPTTPGVAAVPGLPDSARVAPEQAANLARIPTTPLSYYDAQPILQNLEGPASPHGWQGALPFTYHIGPGPARVKMHIKQNYHWHTIWDVIGKVPGSQSPNEWVVAGNHRDAWVYGAVDPNSGTAAMLETVHGIGELLKSGWKPKRTLLFASWDAEEEGLVGSTEWVEQHEKELANAAAYFNMDVGVAGPNFGASAVPSLKQFIRDVTRSVPSPTGASVYEMWKEQRAKAAKDPSQSQEHEERPAAQQGADIAIGDLGSGSDYTAFLQHLGVPSTDINSTGPYGVYHSAFDNFNWFKKFADPKFVYEQQMARVYGIELLRMSDADVLPYDYENYGKEITVYLDTAQKKAVARFGGKAPSFAAAHDAALRLTAAGAGITKAEQNSSANANAINRALREAERAMIVPQGLPDRPWFKHAIYAPGKYTGYAAVVIPGVNEAIDSGDAGLAQQQLAVVTDAINRAAETLERGAK